MITPGSVIAALVFGILSAMAVFSYLYNSRSVGLFHALPVRREGLFLTNYLSGLSFMLLPSLVVFFCTLLAELAKGCLNIRGAVHVACHAGAPYAVFLLLCRVLRHVYRTHSGPARLLRDSERSGRGDGPARQRGAEGVCLWLSVCGYPQHPGHMAEPGDSVLENCGWTAPGTPMEIWKEPSFRAWGTA